MITIPILSIKNAIIIAKIGSRIGKPSITPINPPATENESKISALV